MSKRILLIDSDETFAQGLSNAITARGFVATMATNSEQGMSMAKSESPDLIVVCVEAQPTNGYMLCTRLKKDEQLKGIPVILTSANATADSFEKHKKLKTRAEEYLIKPFESHVMLEKASALMGVQLPPEQVQDEEIVSVEDEPLGLGDLVEGEDEPISLSEQEAAQAQSPDETVVIEEVEEVVVEAQPQGGGDDDLDMFDKAFDSLGGGAQDAKAAPPQAPEEQPREISAPDDEQVLSGLQESAANEAPAAQDDEIRTQLEARVAELEQSLAERDAELEQAKKNTTSNSDLLKSKEAKNRSDKEVLRLKEELNSKEKELLQIQEQQTELETQAQQLKDDALKREAAAKALQQRADALAAAAKKFERELGTAREDAKHGGSLKGKVAELEGELKRRADEVKALKTELETVRTDVTALTGEKDLISEERDELRKQLEEAQVTAVTNEDRAVKAYQKIKGDEKLREKTRKALQIALQLLEENAADGEDAAEPEKQSA